MEYQEYIDNIKNWLISSGPRLLVILILGFISYWIVRFFIDRYIKFYKRSNDDIEALKRADTIKSLLKTILGIVAITIIGAMILGEFGIEIGPLLAAAGVIGIAIGFGSQRLVEDVISGFFILMENQVRIGDVIETAGKDGVVEKVGIRSIILRDFGGNVHFIRNGKIDIITNMTKDYSRYIFEIGVAYKEDLDEVYELIKKVDEDLRNDPEFSEYIIEPIEIMGVDKFADSAVVVRARTKTIPIKQWKVGREFNRRLKKVFDEHNVEIPFPHVTLYMGQSKKGEFTTLNVSNKTVENQDSNKEE